MIISHRHRFLFLKTRKTASTSIEVMLRRWCGPEDVVTTITRIDEREALAAGHPPRNFALDRRIEELYIEHTLAGRDDEAREVLMQNPIRFQNHLGYSQIVQRLEPGRLRGYVVFAVERHPYERAISHASFEVGHAEYVAGRGRNVAPEAVIAHLRRLIANGRIASYANWPIYTHEDRVAANVVVLYQNLQDGLRQVLGRLGLPDVEEALASMPRLKSGLRPGHLTGDDLPEDIRAAIRSACAREFETFGFRP